MGHVLPAWVFGFRAVAPFLVLGEMMSLNRVFWALGLLVLSLVVVGLLPFFGNKFLLIQKKKNFKSDIITYEVKNSLSRIVVVFMDSAVAMSQ